MLWESLPCAIHLDFELLFRDTQERTWETERKSWLSEEKVAWLYIRYDRINIIDIPWYQSNEGMMLICASSVAVSLPSIILELSFGCMLSRSPMGDDERSHETRIGIAV